MVKRDKITPEWMRPATASQYSDVSVRLIRNWLRDGLPHIKRKGIVLIRRTDLDSYLIQFKVESGSKVDAIVGEVMEGFEP